MTNSLRKIILVILLMIFLALFISDIGGTGIVPPIAILFVVLISIIVMYNVLKKR